MLQYLCNAFNDPSNPWYYVIGLLFLLAIFGAIAAYIILSGKKNKSDEQNKDEKPENTDLAQPDHEQSSETDTVSDSQESSDK